MEAKKVLPYLDSFNFLKKITCVTNIGGESSNKVSKYSIQIDTHILSDRVNARHNWVTLKRVQALVNL